jgi:antitoxin ParD1/3/4
MVIFSHKLPRSRIAQSTKVNAQSAMRRGDWKALLYHAVRHRKHLKPNRDNNSYWFVNPADNERRTMAMSADLGETLEKFVTKLVASGRYNSKSEVLREGVRLIQERESRLASLDASIARGLADADAGRVTPAAKVFDRVEAMLRAKAGTKRP